MGAVTSAEVGDFIGITMRPMSPVPRRAVPADVLSKLRLICLELPEAREEAAWTGTRWNIGTKNFAHVLMIDAGWPPAYVRAAGTTGPACVLTFRLSRAHCAAARFRRAPFFRPVWFPNIAGLTLSRAVDWDEVGELIKDSFRVLAPKKLAALVE
jgi:hypothetical protein